MKKSPVTAIILGAGHRAMTYADYSLAHPDELKIVGVAEPDDYRRNMVCEKFGFPKKSCFHSADELAGVPKFADAVINGTMDEQHVATSVPLLKLGYDMLLEKPFAVNEKEMNELLSVVEQHKNKVMICHVLRYTPFYLTIKEKIISGAIGDIINIQTIENVSYHHLSTSFVRGKWGNSDRCRTSMLLAKCCHDIDIMMWMMSPDEPDFVSSYGSVFQFKKQNAPENSGTRCLVDCPLVDTCIYSAKRIYLDHPDRWQVYVWQALEAVENPTRAQRAELLKTSPYGKCIYKCDNNVVDHQSVLVGFKSGATGTHNMTGGAAAPLRTIRITGTRGDIYGEFENNTITVRIINPEPGKDYDVENIDLSDKSLSGHGGGDDNLTADFVRFQRGETPSVSCTDIHKSVAGHKIIFLADESRENGGKAVKVTGL